ncbi:hypothetical protein FEM48_Zijuj05G0157200 [Ziziphus jujuba var. spinosa]|uniref:Uncharacterized protein n=1 Tax=Ziziphus jujuba var. spinosa TaxID=714518 RepID=A0A978VFP2_ZIZJJ|nr:hypothetical protein FEM48_Zijuj05G0157200 [Ziziphus jujuba var. spinosa]
MDINCKSQYLCYFPIFHADSPLAFFLDHAISETTGTVRKTGGNFKEKLKELGGLDAVFEVAINCHSDMEVKQGSYLSQNLFKCAIQNPSAFYLVKNSSDASNNENSCNHSDGSGNASEMSLALIADYKAGENNETLFINSSKNYIDVNEEGSSLVSDFFSLPLRVTVCISHFIGLVYLPHFTIADFNNDKLPTMAVSQQV